MRSQLLIMLLALSLTACLAEAPSRFQRIRNQRQQFRRPVNRFQRLRALPITRTRFFARQEALPAPTPTPYPSADELKPAVQPDLIYGPPAEQLPPSDAPQDFEPNPDVEEFTNEAPEQLETEEPAEIPLPSRLSRRRGPKPEKLQANSPSFPVPARLEAANVPSIAPVAFQFPVQQQYYVLNQPFAYTAQFQAF